MTVKYLLLYHNDDQPLRLQLTQGKWKELLAPEFEKPYFKKIEQHLTSVRGFHNKFNSFILLIRNGPNMVMIKSILLRMKSLLL